MKHDQAIDPANKKVSLILLFLTVFISMPAAGQNLAEQPDAVRRFINEMVLQHDFNADELTQLFLRVKALPSVIKAISNPAESKAWYQYRKIFIKEKRVQAGVTFLREYHEELRTAQTQYGVPAAIITAILGVESNYGQLKMPYLTMNALTTLAFAYPPRAAFFKSQLMQLLLLAREQHVDPFSFKGSYAGAIGAPQFIPSSLRQYAVDFDGDGQHDLVNNMADAIGSVANYLKSHGWQAKQAIAQEVAAGGFKRKELVKLGVEPKHTVAELLAKGVKLGPAASKIAKQSPAALLELQGEIRNEYWLGFANFVAIYRYNPRVNYAMVIFQLSETIKQKTLEQGSQ